MLLNDGQTTAEGRYLYCVAQAGERLSLGEIGIEGREAYTLPYQDICAVVHNCAAQPYQSPDHKVVEAWVMAHHHVVEAAWGRWGAVLPSSFDTIIKGDGGSDAEKMVQDWLKQEYGRLKAKMDRVKGKMEYGVQVFWEPKVVAEDLKVIREARAKFQVKPRGLAYMHRQSLEVLIKRDMETKAQACFQDFYQDIRKHIDEVRVEKAKPAEPGWQMIMNLSCLVGRDKATELALELVRISQIKGFSVHFNGPWPPYSFVGG